MIVHLNTGMMNWTGPRSDTQNGRDLQETLREDRRIILKWIYKTEGVDWIKFAQYRVEWRGFCDRGYKLSDSIKMEYFLNG